MSVGHYGESVGNVCAEPWLPIKSAYERVRSVKEVYQCVFGESRQSIGFYFTKILLAKFGLDDSAHKRPDQLSGGMGPTQRLDIVAATEAARI